MKNIKGYGIDIQDLYDLLDADKIGKAYYGKNADKKFVQETITGHLQSLLERQEGVLEYVASYISGGYALIRNIWLDDEHHKDFDNLSSESKAQEYIWEHIKDFLKDNTDKKEFISKLKPIKDKTLGEEN